MTVDSAIRAALEPGSGWSPGFETASVDEARDYLAALICRHDLEHRTVGDAPLFRHRVGAFRSMRLNDLRYRMHGGEARIHVPEMPGVYLLEVNLAGQSEITIDGRTIPFGSGEIYMVNAHAPHLKRWQTDGRQIIVRIEEGRLRRVVSDLTGGPATTPVLFDTAPLPADGHGASLSRLVRMIGEELDAGSVNLSTARASRSTERMLLELILETIPNNYSHLLQRPETGPLPSPIRRAIDHIHEVYADPISVDELVAMSRISRRALYDGFERWCGMPPMAYLKGIRMARAREALVGMSRTDGMPPEGTVTDAALAVGFTHLGKFARDYRDYFGEYPSQTLNGARPKSD